MSLDLKKRYTNAIAKKLDQLDKCPDKGYYSNTLGTKISGFRDVCRSLANVNKLYKELASQEGVELNLVEISVPEDDDKLLDV